MSYSRLAGLRGCEAEIKFTLYLLPRSHPRALKLSKVLNVKLTSFERR
ncbi:MAG: hypothetical protein RMJ07_01325 [Nitrososphaerota archaeon]|nr:hypothetical protein [Nitrososphaerota archaeon]